MKTPDYLVTYFPDGDGWSATVPDLPGCQTCADTLEGAKEAIKEAIKGYIESMLRHGEEVPPSSHVADTVTVELSA